MNTYVKKALAAYCDQTQTSVAREIAKETLLNSGLTHNDLQQASQKGADSIDLYVFDA
jgi:hypothetical protein